MPGVRIWSAFARSVLGVVAVALVTLPLAGRAAASDAGDERIRSYDVGYGYTDPMWFSTFSSDATRASSPVSSGGSGGGFSGGSAGGGGGGGGSW
jgi:hypothetical protein